jgi:hypothetical protein
LRLRWSVENYADTRKRDNDTNDSKLLHLINEEEEAMLARVNLQKKTKESNRHPASGIRKEYIRGTVTCNMKKAKVCEEER